MDRPDRQIATEKRIYIPMDDTEVFRTVEKMMREEKVYLNPLLTMESLADHIRVHRNLLSRAVNVHAGESFSQWLNRYRIEEAERLAARAAGGKLSMESLAKQVGFSNHTSFYRAVRNLLGTTPSVAFKGKTGK